MTLHWIIAASLILGVVGVAAEPGASWRTSSAEEQRLDGAAFAGFDEGITRRFPDIQSVVVVLQGRTAYQYHRDGKPDTLRDTQSVAKSALVALVGVALKQGQIASLEQPVLDLMPEWRSLNADTRAGAITLHHLLAMKSGFEVSDPSGTATPLAPERAWARPLVADPGRSFAYDNSAINLIMAVLEKLTGRSLPDYARTALVQPLQMHEPSYRDGLHMRTIDMAKLGQLFLQDGLWNGAALMPQGFAAEATKRHSAGGPPVQLPYGLLWWVPSEHTYFASGYGGQLIWVHPPFGMVVALTSTVSSGSQQRGQAIELLRGRLFQAAEKRVTNKEGQPR